MASTYRAVEISSPGVFSLVQRKIAVPGTGQVRIRVEACGVCHSDAATVEAQFPNLSYPRVHNGISQPLKGDVARLTGATATPKNENGLEVFYDFAITPAIRVIPSYQHIWNPADRRRGEEGRRRGCISCSIEFDMVRKDQMLKCC